MITEVATIPNSECPAAFLSRRIWLKPNPNIDASDAQLRVMFIYARAAGTLSVAGLNTGAHTMIVMAGGENAVTEYEDYRPLTAEAALAAAPDVILMFSSRLESLGGQEGLLDLPGIARLRPGTDAS